jgi:hypothetical protein
MRIYCKNGYVVATDTATADSKDTVRVELGGVSLPTPRGTTTAGGLILLEDKLATSPNSHEVEIVASGVADLSPGDRVVVYLGGDDGDISSSGVSAFLPLNGQECSVIPERFLWARIRDGELLPRGRTLLVERDDAAMQRYAFNSSVLHAPDSLMEHGVAAANRADPQAGGARSRDSVTLQYCRVVRVGPDVKDDQLQRGSVVAFSPSYMCTTLVRQLRLPDGSYERKYFALVDSAEVFFCVYE